mgnify:CR=1 FL=1
MMPALASLPAELALVGVVGASLLGVHPLAAPAALACVTTKLVLERALRWQATPAALALAIGQLPHGAWLAWPLLMLALALVVAIPQPSGPPPFTGPCVICARQLRTQLTRAARTRVRRCAHLSAPPPARARRLQLRGGLH